MAREKAPDKRQRILDAALAVFAERGFFGAKVSEVAKAAGVADGTIYLYFENKDDILISLFEQKMEFLIARLRDTLQETGADYALQLTRVVELQMQLALENPVLAKFITVELRQSRKFVREYGNPRFQEYLRLLRGIIENGQAAEVFDPALNAKTVVRSLFGALDELLLTFALGQQLEAGELIETSADVAKLFLRGLSHTDSES